MRSFVCFYVKQRCFCHVFLCKITEQVNFPLKTGKCSYVPFKEKPKNRCFLRGTNYAIEGIVKRLDGSTFFAQMNVSRMPVREALHRLQEAGFVSPYQKAGKVVNQLSRQSLEEITHIRMILETEAARIAIQNSSQDTIAQLERLYSAIVVAIDNGDIDGMLEINKQFHLHFYL